MEQTFASFDEADRFFNRYDEAWLVRDDTFVNYLMEQIRSTK